MISASAHLPLGKHGYDPNDHTLTLETVVSDPTGTRMFISFGVTVICEPCCWTRAFEDESDTRGWRLG